MARTYRQIPGAVNQAVENDGTGDMPGYVPAPGMNFSLVPVPCPANTDTAVKASAGVLYACTAFGTGTTGTVTVKDGSTVLSVITLPAAADTKSFSIPIFGQTHVTNIHVVTSGTGVTATAWAL